MTPDVKAQWLADLRSGEFQQGVRVMHNPEGQFCCLGVLCDQYARVTGESWGEVTSEHGGDIGHKFGHEVNFPPAEVVHWAGLTDFDPNLRHPDAVNGVASISSLNDGGALPERLTFAQIADLIEAQL